MKVHIQRTASWDWAKVFVGGELYREGHDVPDDTYVELLRQAGVEVTTEELPDEEED